MKKLRQINSHRKKRILFPGFSIFGIIIFIAWSVFYKPIYHFNWKGIRESIKDSVLIVAQNPEYVSCGAVGDHEKTPEMYNKRMWIIKNANEFELKRLISFPANNIKVSAFHGLVLKGDNMVYDYLIAFLKDTISPIQYGCDCFVEGLSIGEYCWTKIPITKGYGPVMIDTFNYKFEFTEEQISTIDSLYNIVLMIKEKVD